MSKLFGPNIQLRALEPSDLDKLYLWENDTDLWTTGETITPFSNFQLEQYIAAENDLYTNKQIRLMIDLIQKKETIGCIDLFEFNPFHLRAGLGILIYPREYRRKGYALEAINIMKDYAFDTLGINQLHCSVAANNTASLACMQRANFEICGIRKQWYRCGQERIDEYIMQCINLGK